MSLTEGGLTFRTAGGGDKNSKNQVGLEKFITRGGFSLFFEGWEWGCRVGGLQRVSASYYHKSDDGCLPYSISGGFN